MPEESEMEQARRQIRCDYDERQEEVNHGLRRGKYPIVIHRGKPVAAVERVGWFKRILRVIFPR